MNIPHPSAAEHGLDFAGVSRFEDLIQTDGRARAEQFLAGLYGEPAVATSDAAVASVHFQGFSFAGLRVARVRYGVPAIATAAPARLGWVFSFLESGRMVRRTQGRAYVAGEACVLAPDRDCQLEMSADMQILQLGISDIDLRQACAGLAGSDQVAGLRFLEAVPRGHIAARALCRAVRALAELPRYQAGGPRLERAVKDSVLFELLAAWPNSWSASLEDDVGLPPSARRARDYMHEHVADMPTLGEIAAIAGVSVRALTKSFDLHMGVSPMRYLTRLRLDRVHLELQQAEASSVTEVALRWGFKHMGAFAAAYRERFGVNPATTLKRR